MTRVLVRRGSTTPRRGDVGGGGGLAARGETTALAADPPSKNGSAPVSISVKYDMAGGSWGDSAAGGISAVSKKNEWRRPSPLVVSRYKVVFMLCSSVPWSRVPTFRYDGRKRRRRRWKHAVRNMLFCCLHASSFDVKILRIVSFKI